MPTSSLPLLFSDRDFPDEYRDLIDGRALICGPHDDELTTADAVIAGATRPWNAAAFALGPRVRVISRIGVGYDNVVVADANAAGIAVCYAPLAPSVSTAEHTLALMFAMTKSLPTHIERATHGFTGGVASGMELDGRILGLVGLGRIARRVATAAIALGMRVVACDPFVTESGIEGIAMVSFAEVLATADVVSLHAPASVETRHMIGVETLAQMKPGAYLVNCARGTLVDQDALLVALDSGRLAGAALDVTDPEPLPVGHPLLAHPAVIVTPHIASSTSAGRRRLYEHAIDNALNFLAGQPCTLVPQG